MQNIWDLTKLPGKVSDAELDTLVHSGGAVELTKGFGGGAGESTMAGKDVAQSFLSGETGYGSYSEGGMGHYFAMESLDETTVKRLGLNIDPSTRDASAFSMPYQSTRYSSEGKTVLRAALPADAKIASRALLHSEIEKLEKGEAGQLTSFRQGLLDSGDTSALGVFDSMFKGNIEDASTHAAMLLGYDASTLALSDNEIRVLNRSKLLASEAKTLGEMDSLYPRTPSPTRGSIYKNAHTDTHADRRAMLDKRVADASPQTSAPNIEDLRKLGSSETVEASHTPNPSAEALIRTMRGEIADTDRLAKESLPATRKAVEEDGFLYHYAPKSRRDSIKKHGIVSNQSDTAAQGAGKSFFFLNPEGHTLSQFTPDVSGAGPDAGLDLYRVKASQEMLDQMKVDSHLPLRGGIGQSVYLEGDIAKGGFAAELLSDKVDVSTGKIIPKLKDTPAETITSDKKSEAVIEATKTGEPVIKVGKVVESKGEKVKDSKPKINIADAALSVKDSVVEAAVASATKDETEDEKDIGEVVSEKVEDKIDPIAKIEAKVEGKKKEALKNLADNLIDEDNKRFAEETAAAAPSGRLAGAAGRAPATTGSATKVLAIDSLASKPLAGMPAKVATKTLMADASSMAKSLVGGMKNSKNLRLAATAALLSATGFGIGKIKDRSAGSESQQYSPDEEMELRRSLVNDG